MTWIADYQTQYSIIFSKTFVKNKPEWIEIYDWCNKVFNSNNWHFWYDSTTADNEAVVANFEFLHEHDAVLFQLRWK